MGCDFPDISGIFHSAHFVPFPTRPLRPKEEKKRQLHRQCILKAPSAIAIKQKRPSSPIHLARRQRSHVITQRSQDKAHVYTWRQLLLSRKAEFSSRATMVTINRGRVACHRHMIVMCPAIFSPRDLHSPALPSVLLLTRRRLRPRVTCHYFSPIRRIRERCARASIALLPGTAPHRARLPHCRRSSPYGGLKMLI